MFFGSSIIIIVQTIQFLDPLFPPQKCTDQPFPFSPELILWHAGVPYCLMKERQVFCQFIKPHRQSRVTQLSTEGGNLAK